MWTRRQISSVAIGCLLAGLCAGAVGAQVVERARRIRYLNTGLFALEAQDQAQFNITLDDVRTGAPGRVLIQFLDERGTVVSRDQIVLQAGQSASLQMDGPGLFRVHAELIESGLQLTGRRAVVGTLEVLDKVTGERRPTCSIDEGGSPQGGRQ